MVLGVPPYIWPKLRFCDAVAVIIVSTVAVEGPLATSWARTPGPVARRAKATRSPVKAVFLTIALMFVSFPGGDPVAVPAQVRFP